ncbi:hypothetical protein [Parasitella parasitica]|uniref:Uncharacterized protein n=1 Tax=Parasitella parasitica TaxID=35722 RepID=A0A0B7NNY0_9FUNG|nr:hypothetical protein [Parasitella parasitica]
MFSLEELPLLCRGVSSQFLQLLTVDLSTSNTKFFHKYEDGAFEVGEYPFYIPKQVLKEIGKQIEKTRPFIPVSFDGAFQDIVQKVRGTRAIDYLDIALYIVPTLFVPEMTNTQAANANIKLTRGFSLSLQWEFTERTLN